jgi:hypothetical protein
MTKHAQRKQLQKRIRSDFESAEYRRKKFGATDNYLQLLLKVIHRNIKTLAIL